MKRNTSIRRIASALLALLIPISYAVDATEKGDPTKVASSHTGQLRDYDYYKAELRKLEASTKRIHQEVDRIVKEFRKNMEEYYKRTKGSGTKQSTQQKISTTTIWKLTEEELQQKDGLKSHDYSQSPILIMEPNLIKQLQIRKKFLNPVETHGQRLYQIDGKTFERQNVDGVGNRCFFNSVGLTRDEVVEQLKSEKYFNDSKVRYMFANDIISEEVGWNIQRIKEQARGDLQINARSLKAFNTFVNDKIGKNIMMPFASTSHTSASEIDVIQNANLYGSSDAIADINGFGIKIYKPRAQSSNDENFDLYLFKIDADVDADHTPAIKKETNGQYSLWVRQENGSVSKPIDPKKVGIDVETLNTLWNKFIYEAATLSENDSIFQQLAKPEFQVDIHRPAAYFQLYLAENSVKVNLRHTPALMKIKEDQYRLFVLKDGVIVDLDPATLGIDIEILNNLWNQNPPSQKEKFKSQYVRDEDNVIFTSIKSASQKHGYTVNIVKPQSSLNVYLAKNDAVVDAGHTPALKQIKKDQYRLFVRQKGETIAELDPTILGIRIKDLNDFWQEKAEPLQHKFKLITLGDKTTPNRTIISKPIITQGGHFTSPLVLQHQFIPKGVKEIAYVYHEGLHFQALIPQG